jgi:hypothetical protein
MVMGIAVMSIPLDIMFKCLPDGCFPNFGTKADETDTVEKPSSANR